VSAPDRPLAAERDTPVGALDAGPQGTEGSSANSVRLVEAIGEAFESSLTEAVARLYWVGAALAGLALLLTALTPIGAAPTARRASARLASVAGE
jgi:hypothetical protein